jgi:hypothetical protein
VARRLAGRPGDLEDLDAFHRQAPRERHTVGAGALDPGATDGAAPVGPVDQRSDAAARRRERSGIDLATHEIDEHGGVAVEVRIDAEDDFVDGACNRLHGAPVRA